MKVDKKTWKRLWKIAFVSSIFQAILDIIYIGLTGHHHPIVLGSCILWSAWFGYAYHRWRTYPEETK